MAIIPRVKCSRCDRSYSGLQSKCPYCGARRSKGGKYGMPEDGDPKWRLAVGVILLVAVICTIIALVNLDTGSDNATADTKNTPTETTVSPEPTTSGSADAKESASPEVSPSPGVSDEEETLETISSISVQWQFFSGTSEMTINVGDGIPLTAVITPSTADVEVTWTSDNTAVCTVDSKGNLKAVGTGKANVIAEYNGVQGELVVRVN